MLSRRRVQPKKTTRTGGRPHGSKRKPAAPPSRASSMCGLIPLLPLARVLMGEGVVGKGGA